MNSTEIIEDTKFEVKFFMTPERHSLVSSLMGHLLSCFLLLSLSLMIGNLCKNWQVLSYTLADIYNLE